MIQVGWTKTYTKEWLDKQKQQLELLESWVDKFPDDYYFEPYIDRTTNISLVPISKETATLARRVRNESIK